MCTSLGKDKLKTWPRFPLYWFVSTLLFGSSQSELLSSSSKSCCGVHAVKNGPTDLELLVISSFWCLGLSSRSGSPASPEIPLSPLLLSGRPGIGSR